MLSDDLLNYINDGVLTNKSAIGRTPDNKKNEKKIIDGIISLFNHFGFFSVE
jgi:hypothetical protein